MSTDTIARIQPQTAIAQRATVAPLEFTAEQRKMIRDTFLNGASDSEAAVLMELARIRRLNPITQQIHFVKRWNGQRRMEVWAAQVGIDGFRTIAERTGLYDGQDEAEYEYDAKGALKLCRVRVYRKDWSRPAVGVAHFSEYVQNKKEGGPNIMWATKPHIMLAKCAEALAFRKGFPEDTSGLYAPEEMPHEERELNPPPAPTVPPLGEQMAATSQTAAMKENLKARRVVIEDVPEAKPDPMAQIAAIGKAHGFEGKRLASVIKGATGKEGRAQLVQDDVQRVSDALDALKAETTMNPETGEIPFGN